LNGEQEEYVLWQHPERSVVAERLYSFVDDAHVVRIRALLHRPDRPSLTVGWMHVRLTEFEVVIEELFVWPPHRTHHFGSAMAEQALLHLAMMGHRTVRWEMTRADAVVLQRSDNPPIMPSWLTELAWEPASNPRPLDAGICGQTARVEVFELLEHLSAAR
jgi:GNAT superfamily N-acetyltransferase